MPRRTTGPAAVARLRTLASALQYTGVEEDRAVLAAQERGPGARSGPAREGYNIPNPLTGLEDAGSPPLSAPALLTQPRTQLLHAVSPGPAGLSDADVRGFCARGFIVIKPTLSAAHHAANLEEFNRLQDDVGDNRGFGSNRGSFGMCMPGLSQVYDDPAVVSARQSLLGPGNVMHPHNATHLTEGGGSANQVWHKDPYGPEAAVRHKHAFRICMALYYPQTTTLRLGPTGIVPGRYSHTVLSSTHCMAAREIDQPLTVAAGSVVLIHGDTWHRAMKNSAASGTRRYMLKFYFVRMVEPYMCAPSWDYHPSESKWAPVDGGGQDDDAAEATWRWLLGGAAVAPPSHSSGPTPTAATAAVAALAEDNEHVTEQQRIAAIFEAATAVAAEAPGGGVAEALLGVLSSKATEAAVAGILTEAWTHSTNEYRGPRRQSKACNPSGTNPADLDAMHALAAAGAPALPLLRRTLTDVNASWWVRAAAAAAIGSLGPAVTDDDSLVAVLAAIVTDPSAETWLRRNCAESLGYVLPPTAPLTAAAEAVPALLQALAERDLLIDDEEQVAGRSFEYDRPASYHETVRQAAATALARVTVHPWCALHGGAELAQALYTEFSATTTHKLNAVTRWSCLVALERLGTAEARELLAAALQIY